jgi:hypothetical protein
MSRRLVYVAFALGLALGLTLLVMAGLGGSAAAAVSPSATLHYVVSDGDCNGLLPCYATLQAAVDAAAAGDEIRVAWGVYSGVTSRGGASQVLHIAKDITLRGGYNDDFVSWTPYAFPTVVDAGGAGRAVYVMSGVSVTLDGFHVTGGAADRGAGILLEGVASATVRNSWVYSNTASGRGGDIDVEPPDGVYENQNGAMVWNGHAWVITETWAHTYLSNVFSGRRLIAHRRLGTVDGGGPTGVVFVREGYTVTQRAYTYAVPAAVGTDYIYEAIEYGVTQPDGKRLILRSRGCGPGTVRGYFDIYIQDPYAGESVGAFRADPVMYVYDTSLDEAALVTDKVQGAFASLPTFAPRERARYWLDVNQGADMGGYGYSFRTADLGCQTQHLGSSVATSFWLMYYDCVTNTATEIKLLPKILSEMRAPTPTPTVTPTPTRTTTPTATPTATATATEVPTKPVYLPLVLR